MAGPVGAHTLNFLVDKFHDPIYDRASNIPQKLPGRRHRNRNSAPPDQNQGQDQGQGQGQQDQGQQGRGDMGDDYDDGDHGDSGYGQVNDDYYYAAKPRGGNTRARSADARDYGRGDSGYGAAPYNPADYAPGGKMGAMRRDAYGEPYAPQQGRGYYGGERYKQIEDGGSGAQTPRDREDARSRRSDEWDSEEEDERRERRLAKRGKRERRGRSRSRGKSGEESGGEDDKQTEMLKKWGATFAGAAIGAYGGRRAGKGNESYIPSAIGAIIGGLAAREGEKYYVKHRKEKKEERALSSHR